MWGLVPASIDSGISRPSDDVYKRTPLGTTYDTFDSERYVLTAENRALRDIAANAPYDVVEILLNSEKYGGGGIYGLYSTVAADNLWAPYIFVHEFGHHLAGPRGRVLHVRRRVSAGGRPRRAMGAERDGAARRPSKLKWKDLVEPGTPLPTPWSKDAVRREIQKEGQKRRREIRAQHVRKAR